MIQCINIQDYISQIKKKVNFDKPNDANMIFFKSRAESITDKNMHSLVSVVSVGSSPYNSLYNTLQKVFLPLFLNSQKSGKLVRYSFNSYSMII